MPSPCLFTARLSSLLTLVALGCPGDDGGTASTPSTSGVATTGPATSDPLPTTGDATTEGTTDGTTAGTSSGPPPECTGPRLLSRWPVPDMGSCLGIGIDDSGAVVYLVDASEGDTPLPTLVRVVDGEVAWSVTHDSALEYVIPYGLAVRGDGVAMIVGHSADQSDYAETVPWAATYDADGALLFDDIELGNVCPEPCVHGGNEAVVVNPAGEFLVAGYRGDYVDFQFEDIGVLRRYDAGGQIAETTFPLPYPNTENHVSAMSLADDGSVVVFGDSEEDFNNTDWFFARLAADGTYTDGQTLSIDEEDEARGVAALSDGSIVFTAWTGTFSDSKSVMIRLGPDYAPIWQKEVEWPGETVLRGPGDATYSTIVDYQTIEKITKDGDLLWSDDPCLDGYQASAFALSPDSTRLVVYGYYDESNVIDVYDTI